MFCAREREREMVEEGGAVMAAVVTDTRYGTANVVSLTSESSSVLGRASEPPPTYDSLALVHKQHVNN